MTNIHPVAAEDFGAGAAAYVAGRPDYPPEIEAVTFPYETLACSVEML